MKKVLLLISLMSLCITANAQFTVTKDGIKPITDKEYYVVDVAGKTSEELYNNVLSYIVANFQNPDAVANKLEGQMINLHGNFPEAMPCQEAMGKISCFADVELNLVMYFKDGRIRFDSPTIHSMICHSRKTNYGNYWTYYFYAPAAAGQLTGDFSLFKKNGEVKNEIAVNGLNTFINNLITEIVDSAAGESNLQNW